jgi:alpha-L-arabinofuranosidase
MPYKSYIWLLLAALLALTGCTGRPSASDQPSPAPTSDISPTALPPVVQPTVPPSALTEGIVIFTDQPSQPFDRNLLGTNIPAWLGSARLSDQSLQQRLADLGPSLIRLPGGSWSNHYAWLGCELGDTETCFWPWAARPSDFLAFLRATEQEAIWTVSINGTAAEAAALVAFFNGAVDDERPIGVDVRGQDWLTVGHWARLRAEQGFPEPYPIRFWEVGNEVYGATPAAGPDCAAFGWEEVWTCDGVEYVFGKGNGSDRREGYLEFRTAMRAVDPEILVGAVGVDAPGAWSNWGNEVILGAGSDLDFYVVHHYGFSNEPRSAAAALSIPQQTWAPMIRELHEAMDRHNGRRVPIAVTEYNLVAFLELDTADLMRRAVNALYIADTIGQFAEQGVTIANQWNLANGAAANGADYGLVDSDTFEIYPQYYALALWQNFGTELLALESSFQADQTLSAYAGRDQDGSLTLLAINKTASPISTTIQFLGLAGERELLRYLVEADALESLSVRYNGTLNTDAPPLATPPTSLGRVNGLIDQTFPPFSITLLRLSPAS